MFAVVVQYEPSLIECFGGGRLRNIITKKKQYHYE